MKQDDFWFYATITISSLFLLCIFVWGIMSANVSSRCFEKGYPNSRLSWDLNAYCVKRFDQTDFIVPLKDVEK